MAGYAMAERTPEHRASTLAGQRRANEVRLARAAVRRRIRGLPKQEGREAVAALVEETPDCCGSAMVGDVLAWPYRTGPFQVRQTLRGLELSSSFVGVAVVISEAKRLDALTGRQRRALAAYLRGEEVVA